MVTMPRGTFESCTHAREELIRQGLSHEKAAEAVARYVDCFTFGYDSTTRPIVRVILPEDDLTNLPASVPQEIKRTGFALVSWRPSLQAPPGSH